MNVFEKALKMNGKEDGDGVFMLSALCGNAAVVETGAGMEGCQQDSSLVVYERIRMGNTEHLGFMVGLLQTCRNT